MSDRPGQLLVYDDAGNFIGGANILIAPTASVVNGRLSLPGLSEGIDGLPANPTASVGLAAVNGAATTFMRSDAAPPLSQAISPTWTGPHTFRGGFLVEDAGGADRIWLDSNAIYLQTASTTAVIGDFAFGLNVGGASWVVVDDATHSMDLGDVDNWGNLTHVAIEDDDEQVRLHATTVKVEKGLLTLGVAGTALGKLTLAGNTSGVVTVQPLAAAGTWTLTLPANAGTNRFPLLTNGAGVTSWSQLGAADISGLGSAATLNVGTASGDIPVLGAGGKLASSVIPALAISETFVVASQAAMLALSTAETGDVAVRTDLNKSFILAGSNPGTLAHWQELLTPTDAVLSVNGQTGVVVLTTSNIAEGSNLYWTQGRFDTAFAAKSTTNLTEGTNLYYTDERVDDRVAALILGTANQITPTYNDGAGTLTLSLPQNIHTGASPTFVGLTLSGNLSAAGVASSLIPSVTDTYDLGSSTKLWRKGWLSELDAVLFAQNTVSVIGGWLLVTKNEGAIPVGQDVGTGDTTIDFGQAMTANDFVLFRAAGSVEYVQVGSVVSGTRYNVTRNLDGTGANAWPAGSVYAVLGNTGNGRIEINANSTPRISLIKQGATYNAQTELLRVGDLNGGWLGYSSETYGFAVGEYAAGKAWLSVDPTNGIRIGLHSVINGQWDTSGNLALGQVATNSGNAFWNNSNKRFEFRGGLDGTVVQAYVNTTGAIVGGGGNVTLDATGLSLTQGTGTSNAIEWRASTTLAAYVYGSRSSDTAAGSLAISARGSNTQSTPATVNISATNDANTVAATLQLTALSTYAHASFTAGASNNDLLFTIGSLVTTVIGTYKFAASGAGCFERNGVSTQQGLEGLALINTTAAAAGSQQFSPALRLSGQGWKTNATAASQRVDWSIQAVAVQGAAAPTSYLDFASQVGGGGYTSRLTLTSGGDLAVDTDTLFVNATDNRVGMGTTSPVVQCHVLKDQNAVTALRVSNNNTGVSAFASFQLVATGGGFSGSFFQNGSGNTQYGGANSFNMVQQGNAALTLCTNDLVRLTVSGAGALRLHTYGAGTLTTDASGNVTAVSDERLKRIRGEFSEGLGIIRQLKPIVYKWKEGEGHDTEHDYIGFSAQNVQAALPLAVMAGPNGMLSLQDRPLIAATVNAVKELDTRIAEMERELETLKRARSK